METVGVDHFIFGTDAPPLTSLKQAGVNVIKALKLSPTDEQKVFAGNAKNLLKI
jgi:predicted TIM-barrel fold metal-dependent hydrolase